jgi:hypothetical protein
MFENSNQKFEQMFHISLLICTILIFVDGTETSHPNRQGIAYPLDTQLIVIAAGAAATANSAIRRRRFRRRSPSAMGEIGENNEKVGSFSQFPFSTFSTNST